MWISFELRTKKKKEIRRQNSITICFILYSLFFFVPFDFRDEILCRIEHSTRLNRTYVASGGLFVLFECTFLAEIVFASEEE